MTDALVSGRACQDAQLMAQLSDQGVAYSRRGRSSNGRLWIGWTTVGATEQPTNEWEAA